MGIQTLTSLLILTIVILPISWPVVEVAWTSTLGADPTGGAATAALTVERVDDWRIVGSRIDRGELLARVEQETILSLVRRHRSAARDSFQRSLAEVVYRESVAAGVDPLMTAAIVAKESSFRSRVVSHAGAVGLMQLRPFVARDLAERLEVEWQGNRTLNQPELNVRLGVRYYQELVERFDGDTHLALAAYNRGPSRLTRQISHGTTISSRYADGILALYQELDDRRRTLHVAG